MKTKNYKMEKMSLKVHHILLHRPVFPKLPNTQPFDSFQKTEYCWCHKNEVYLLKNAL